jgi:hypothetical protein
MELLRGHLLKKVSFRLRQRKLESIILEIGISPSMEEALFFPEKPGNLVALA